MVLFHTFLFVFSLRLGAIIIGIVTLVKSSIWLILTFWRLDCIPDFSKSLKEFSQKHAFSAIADMINLYANLQYFLIGLAVFYSLEILVCIFLLMGAYQLKPNFIFPFLWFYIPYTFFLCLDLMLLYLFISKHYDGLEITIMYFSVAFFVLVYCIYAWCCVYSLIKVIRILQKQVIKKIKPRTLKQPTILLRPGKVAKK